MSETQTPAPAVTGQTVGLAHYASRALLVRILDTYGMSFEQSILLNYLADETLDRDELIRRAVHGLKVADDVVLAALADLRDDGIVTGDAEVELSAAGRQRQREIRERTAPITARLWGDIPPADVAAAGRVLATVTERANAELASLP